MVAPAAEARGFGKYTLVAKLATGGMAEIFLARLHGDGGFEKLVCIKRILPHLARDPQFVSMFLDEARVAARISHPNVCQVFELGEWHGQYYIAMEYLEGVPLSCFRRTDYYAMRPDPRLVAAVGVQACEGLHHAHQLKRPDGELLGVVHRDVSPQNLFVTLDGIVKVLDFGIAKVQDASSKTSTGAVKGTYAYMSPEQLRNERLDRRTDVWAMGTVLWETLAQQHLFKRDTEFLTFQAITNDRIPDICELRPDVPPLLGDTIMRALSRNREDRFPSARALGEALAQAVAPLGGPLGAAALADEVSTSFESTLAEQRQLLALARQGGEFDLNAERPLVGHGTALATTPVSNLKRRVAEAQAEVEHYLAAQQAIAALDDEPVSASGFTPPPQRDSRPYPAQAPRRTSKPFPAQRTSQPYATAEPVSGPYNVAPAEWRSRDDTPMPSQLAAPPTVTITKTSGKLPWIIALVAVAVASVAGALLWANMQQKEKAAAAAAAAPAPASDNVVAMKTTPGPVDPPPTAPIVEKTVEKAAVETPAADAKPETKIDAKTETKTDAKPEPKTETKVTKAQPAPHPAPVEKHVLKAPPPPPPDKAPAGPPGFITIDSAPVYAVIFIDGKKLGETPLVHISLPPGKHAVKAVSPSGTSRALSITIEPGKTAPVRRIEW